MTHHLRVQLTLLPAEAGSRRASIPAGEYRTVFTASGRHFAVAVYPRETVVPGGPAVHCEVTLAEPAVAQSFFPAGTQFEMWESGRRGYGYVLARLT